MLEPQVFKAYDIRGVYGVEWDADGAALITSAFIEKFGVKQLVLGWDMRVSSPEMVAAVTRAAVAAGVRVIKVGQVPTPVLYFATAGYTGNDAGLIITASHNTGEWNDMKWVLGNGAPVGETSGLLDVEARALAGGFVDAPVAGSIEEIEVVDDYLDKVISMAPLDATKPLSIVIDCGNGMEGATIKKLLARLPMVNAHVMYDTPDGAFPNHEANPLKSETLRDLQREVVARGASIGVAFDGDADRIGFVDEKGNIVSADALTGLIGCELLKTHPGATILYDLRSRRSVARAVVAAGGTAVMTRVGHAFIKKQMREVGGLFAGELSCHFYFQEYYGVECADAMMLYVLKLMQDSGKPLSELAAEFLHDAHSGEINFEVRDRVGAMQRLEEKFGGSAREVLRLDGLLFDMDGWWFSVRPSNTEPLLRLNLEARDAEMLKEKIAEVQTLIS